ncbi:MAG TPA: hypothetical protein DEA08_22215 [Planctomycetes bacterium]|nr:hypothetical protein [Planctomycetota bacterium]
MRLRLKSLYVRWARRVQRAYAQAVLAAPPPQGGGAPGGSLAQEVRSARWVAFKRWGFVFSPSRIGERFRFWWRGTRRQRARGSTVSLDESRLADELEAELVRQIRAMDRRS